MAVAGHRDSVQLFITRGRAAEAADHTIVSPVGAGRSDKSTVQNFNDGGLLSGGLMSGGLLSVHRSPPIRIHFSWPHGAAVNRIADSERVHVHDLKSIITVCFAK